MHDALLFKIICCIGVQRNSKITLSQNLDGGVLSLQLGKASAEKGFDLEFTPQLTAAPSKFQAGVSDPFCDVLRCLEGMNFDLLRLMTQTPGRDWDP